VKFKTSLRLSLSKNFKALKMQLWNLRLLNTFSRSAGTLGRRGECLVDGSASVCAEEREHGGKEMKDCEVQESVQTGTYFRRSERKIFMPEICASSLMVASCVPPTVLIL
jgi:hypothetical protein